MNYGQKKKNKKRRKSGDGLKGDCKGKKGRQSKIESTFIIFIGRII